MLGSTAVGWARKTEMGWAMATTREKKLNEIDDRV